MPHPKPRVRSIRLPAAAALAALAAGCALPDSRGPAAGRPTAEVASAPAPAPPAPSPTPDARSLFDRLGGEPGIRAIVDEFFARKTVDPLLAPRFANANLARLHEMAVAHAVAATGGPDAYEGRDMRTAHAGMKITDEEFDAFLRNLRDALAARGVGEREAREFLALNEAERPAMVESVSARLARIEGRLDAMQVVLDAAAERIGGLADALEAARRDSAALAATTPPEPAPRATPEPAPEPIRLPEPVAESAPAAPPPATGEAGAPARDRDHDHEWLPGEVELAPELVEAYTEGDAPASEGDPGGLELVGRPLEPARFLSSAGGVLDLASFRGKKSVVLVVMRGFGGAVCLNCSAQLVALAGKIDEFRARDAEVVVVYPGDAATVPKFVAATRKIKPGFEPPFPVALDVELAAVRAFMIEGSLAKPTTMIVDREGVVRWAYVGRQPGDRPSVAAILERLDALGGAGPRGAAEDEEPAP